VADERWGRGPGLALGARALAVPIQAVVTIATTRLILDGLGVPGFAAFAVLISLPNLVSFAGVGIGAAVTDAVAARKETSPATVAGVLVTTVRVSALIGLAIAAAAMLLTAVGVWPAVLGAPAQEGLNLGTGLALALFGLYVPVSVGQSILLGAHRNHVSILCQAVGSLVGLGGIVVAHARHDTFVGYAVAPYVGLLAGALLALTAASRVRDVAIGPALRDVLRPVRGERIRHLSGAMTWIVVFSTLATQSDRLVLGHLSTPDQVAVYAVAIALLSSCVSLIQAAGLSLWPVFASERSSGRRLDRTRFHRILGIFAAGGVAMLTGFVIAGPWVTAWISDGASGSSVGLMAWCGVLVLLQAVWWPMGMLMTDAPGLRGQAWANLVAAVLNIGVSIALAGLLGAAGPVIGTVVGTAALILWGRRPLATRLSSRPPQHQPVG
jgi:O-antigen/teichoic acid export membrane protein